MFLVAPVFWRAGRLWIERVLIFQKMGLSPILPLLMNESGSRGEGVGHFYYGIDGVSGEQRRLELAKSLYAGGLR
ncbi:hypothetical protein [Pseudomonas sp. CLCA07]